MQDPETERRKRFDALFAWYSPDILAYCQWRARNSSDAQDAVAEVFLTAWRRFDDLPRSEDDRRVWLYATARRVLANQRRANRRRVALRERLQLEATSASAMSAPSGDDRLVHDALRRLPPRDREVLLLAEWEGLSPAEIAGVLGCLTVTARGRLHRARRRFRFAFERLREADRMSGRPAAAAVPTTSALRRPGSVIAPRRPAQLHEGGS
jgi:RNA polymerase sigma-70 factor (ECF subfamily)